MKKTTYSFLSFFVFASLFAQNPGDPDTSFGFMGYNLYNRNNESEDVVYAIAMQDDGKILAAGDSGGFTVVRILGNGNLDPGFASNGRFFITPGIDTCGVCSGIRDIAVLENGNIIIVGSREFAGTDRDIVIIRLTPSGNLDLTYADN